MKIKVEVELAEGEAGLATSVTKMLQGLTDNVSTTIRTDKVALAKAILEAVASGQIDTVAHDLSRRWGKPELYQDTIDTFCTILFEPSVYGSSGGSSNNNNTYSGGGMRSHQQDLNATNDAGTMVQIISWQHGPVKAQVLDEVLTRVMNTFSTSRRPDSSRRALMPYCEVFAALLKATAIPVKGAVQAVTALIQSETTRVAGITCLGKLIEQCADTLVERCDPNTMDRLRAALGNVSEEHFLYDLEYITEPLGWSTPSKNNSGGGSSSSNPSLIFQRACRHHTQSILSLAYSPGRDIIVSASSDGTIGTWDCATQGSLVETCTLARHFACSVDVSSRGNILLVAGAGQNSGTAPAVVYYAEESNHWGERGAVQPENVRIISAATILKAQQGFFFACGLHGPNGSKVAYYDGVRNQSIREFNEHTDVVTAIYAPVDRENTIVTGSRDSQLMLYDVRAPSPPVTAQMFGTVSAITGIGDYLVCGGLDKRLWVYDSRMMQAIAHRDLDSAILDISISQHSTCAVSTLTSLSIVNLQHMAGPTNKADHGASNNSRYHSIQWHSSGTMLMAGGDNGNMDIYGWVGNGN